MDETTEMKMPARLTESERIVRDKVKQDAQARSTRSYPIKRQGITIMVDAYKVTATYKLLHMLEDKYIAMRLRRRAYVCAGGEVKQEHDEGYSSITDAFIARPKDCKYCVFEKPEGGAILVNMFELIQTNRTTELTAKPDTAVEFPSVDAAMMYALTIE